MGNLKNLNEMYKFDLQLHSSINPIKDSINYQFEKEIEQTVIQYLKDNVRFKGDRKILFAGFIDRAFNAVLVEELCDDMLLVTALNTENMKVTSTHMKRNDCKKPLIKYTSVELTNLPIWLRLILKSRLSEDEQGFSTISTHRFISALKYDIKDWVIHHTKYVFSSDETDTRKIPDDSIEYLLPVTSDFHTKVIHQNYYDIKLDNNDNIVELKGNSFLETLNNFIEPKLPWNIPTVEQIKNVLIEYYKNNKSIIEISIDNTLPSRTTITKIIDRYKVLAKFI